MRKTEVTCDVCGAKSDRIQEATLKLGGSWWTFDVCLGCFGQGASTFRALWAKLFTKKVRT